MTAYIIDLYDANGAVRETRAQGFPHDDAAIDSVGRIDHPHEIKVWQGGRLVAHFPALRLSRRDVPRPAPSGPDRASLEMVNAG